MKRILIGVLLLLAGCAAWRESPTVYAKADPDWGNAYGYRDKRIGGDEFSITATGNRATAKEQVAGIALRRAAELAKEHGRSHFVLVKQRTEVMAAAQVLDVPLSLRGAMLRVPVGETLRYEPTAILIIRLLPAQPPYPPDALDADEVLLRMAQRPE